MRRVDQKNGLNVLGGVHVEKIWELGRIPWHPHLSFIEPGPFFVRAENLIVAEKLEAFTVSAGRRLRCVLFLRLPIC